MKIMFASLALAVAVTTTACGPRQVEVTTGAQPAADVSIRLTNNLTQAVNLYVTSGGTDVFLKQVGASTVEVVPVHGINAGTTVTLKARTVDGTRTYTRDNVYLAANYEWRVP
jgi:ABC-type Zn uptake system ZnuABC Zn-binding protein ZnuA